MRLRLCCLSQIKFMSENLSKMCCLFWDLDDFQNDGRGFRSFINSSRGLGLLDGCHKE